MKSCFLYILYSRKIDRFYVGISFNPEARLHYHNNSNKGWTRRGRPWELIFAKKFPSKEIAHKWELWIKRQKSRQIIESIINKTFDWNMRFWVRLNDK